MSIFLDVAGGLVVAVVVAFVASLVSLRRLPTDRRPEVTVYSGSGRSRGARTLAPPSDEPPAGPGGKGQRGAGKE